MRKSLKIAIKTNLFEKVLAVNELLNIMILSGIWFILTCQQVLAISVYFVVYSSRLRCRRSCASQSNLLGFCGNVPTSMFFIGVCPGIKSLQLWYFCTCSYGNKLKLVKELKHFQYKFTSVVWLWIKIEVTCNYGKNYAKSSWAWVIFKMSSTSQNNLSPKKTSKCNCSCHFTKNTAWGIQITWQQLPIWYLSISHFYMSSTLLTLIRRS